MYVDLTHTSSFTSSDEHHAHTHREVQAVPSRSDRVTTRRRTSRGDTSRPQKAKHTILSVSSRRTRWTPESWPGSRLKIRFWPATTKRRGGSTGCGLSLGRGQLPGSTTGKATTEALAVDAICLPSDMLQDRIWGLSCKAAQLVEGQVEQVGSAYLGG